MPQCNENSQVKAQYSKPKVVVYGEFANLTAGGVGSIAEASGMSMDRQIRT